MKQFSKYHQPLTKRYLLWAYKSTRESFERIERKTTQLSVDEFIATRLSKNPLPLKNSDQKEYARLLAEFDAYIATKKSDEIKLKYADASKKKYHPQYVYFLARLTAIEAAIVKMLGKKVLKEFEELFEGEFTRRILESKDH